MKKIILSLITAIMVFMLVPVTEAAEKPKVTDHEKVTIYIFWGNGCPNCTNAINYFYNLGDEYADYIEFETYEVWHNSNNSSFAQEVASSLDHELKGVPFLVVGKEYISGWGDSVGETMINYALDYYQDKNYKDVVKEAEEKTEYELEKTSLKDAYELEESQNNTNTTQPEVEGGKYDALIIIGIFVVLIGGFAALVVVGKK